MGSRLVQYSVNESEKSTSLPSDSTMMAVLPLRTIRFSRMGSSRGSSSSSMFSMSMGLPKDMQSSRWFRKFLSLSVVTFIAFTSSRFLIHCEPWPCGSTSTGYRVARVVIMPFWMLSSSVGKPCRFHSPISDSSTKKRVTSRFCVTGIPRAARSP